MACRFPRSCTPSPLQHLLARHYSRDPNEGFLHCSASPPSTLPRSSIHASSCAASSSDSSSSRQSHMEAKRRCRSWLGNLPFDVLIQIAGNVTVTSWSPMEDLCALWGTCRFMRRLCKNPEVGRRINLERVSSSNNRWSRRIAYQALLYRLTNVGNPQPCFITRISSALSRAATKKLIKS